MFLSTKERNLLASTEPEIIARNLEKLGWLETIEGQLTLWTKERDQGDISGIVLVPDKEHLGYADHLLKLVSSFCHHYDISTFEAINILTDSRDHTDIKAAPRDVMLFFYF